MSILNNSIGTIGTNPNNLPQKKPKNSGSNFQSATSSNNNVDPKKNASIASSSVSSLSYTTTGQILIDDGQIFRGEVTDIRNNTVSIKVDLGDTITYPLEGDPELSIGEIATFKATKTNDTLTLRAISRRPSAARLSTINKALEEANLPKTEKNQTIVLELLNNHMSIDKQSIQKILQQTLLNKEISVQTLVLMVKHNLPITPESALQFEQYRTKNHYLSDQINSLADEIPKVLDKTSTFTTAENFNRILQSLLDTILTANDNESDTALGNLLPAVSERNDLISLLKPYNLSSSFQTAILDGSASLREVANCIQSSIKAAEQMQETALLTDDSTETTLRNTSLTDAFQSPVVRKILDYHTSLQFKDSELLTFLSAQNRQSLLHSLSAYPLSAQVKESIEDGTIRTNTLLNLIKDTYPLTDKNQSNPLFSSQTFQWVVKEQIKHCFSLSAHTLSETSIKDYYEDTYNRIHNLKELLQSTGLNSAFTELSNSTTNLQDNMDFMKALNTLFPYIQLPVKMKDKLIHSDLYVFTKKKNLREHQDSVSVLLHLDMDHLGELDVHITLNKDQITSKFYVTDEYSKSLLSNNIDHVVESLLSKGFYMKSEFYDKKKDFDLVTDVILKDQPETPLKRYSFDIRA